MKYGNHTRTYGTKRFAHRWNKIAHSPISILVLLVVSFFLIKAAWNIYNKSQITQERLVHTQEEIAKIGERHKILQSKVASLSTDAGVEAEMRTKYRATKEGELVAVIVDEKETPAAVTVVETPTFWQKILRLIGVGK